MADSDEEISDGEVDADVLAAEEEGDVKKEKVAFEGDEPDIEEDIEPPADTSYEYREIEVRGDDRTMSQVLDANEAASIIAIRTQQISEHRNEMIPIGDMDTAEKIATEELRVRRCPLLVRRDYPRLIIGSTVQVKFEMWNPNEMVHAIPL